MALPPCRAYGARADLVALNDAGFRENVPKKWQETDQPFPAIIM